MNQQLIEIGIRRGRLIERIATQRAILGRRVQPVHDVLDAADRTLAAVRTGTHYVKSHPGMVASVAALLVVLKPRRAWRWGRRTFIAWRTWRALREQLQHFEVFELRRRRS